MLLALSLVPEYHEPANYAGSLTPNRISVNRGPVGNCGIVELHDIKIVIVSLVKGM